MIDEVTQAMLPTVILAIVAVFVYEGMRSEQRDNAKVCICQHRQDAHVKFRDWDSSAWIAGAEFKPGQCRKCLCRSFRQSLG